MSIGDSIGAMVSQRSEQSMVAARARIAEILWSPEPEREARIEELAGLIRDADLSPTQLDEAVGAINKYRVRLSSAAGAFERGDLVEKHRHMHHAAEQLLESVDDLCELARRRAGSTQNAVGAARNTVFDADRLRAAIPWLFGDQPPARDVVLEAQAAMPEEKREWLDNRWDQQYLSVGRDGPDARLLKFLSKHRLNAADVLKDTSLAKSVEQFRALREEADRAEREAFEAHCKLHAAGQELLRAARGDDADSASEEDQDDNLAIDGEVETPAVVAAD